MNGKLQSLREKAANLPMTPGVYIMLDRDGTVIYVGKAKKLKNRVSSYFRGAHNAKVEAMVEKIDDFEVFHVKTEFEALMLENAQIKKYKPHYNILLKDDKGYPFVTVDQKSEWPRFEISSRKKGKVYGPYGGRAVTREILQSLSEALKLPTCAVQFPQGRPCLNYRIGRCDGWCRKEADREEYLRRMDQAGLILEGKSGELIAALKEKMLKASDELNFEYAASLRDRIKSIENLSNTERVSSGWAERNLQRNETVDNEAKYNRTLRTLDLLSQLLGLERKIRRIEAFDISNLGDTGIVAAMTCHSEGKPLKSAYRKFRIRDLSERDDYASMYQAVFRRYKHAAEGDEAFLPLPDLLLIDGGAQHAAVAVKALSDLGLDLPVFGMVKDSRHRTRALMSPDGREIGIAANQALFSMIGSVQEETHRFAIEYQRQLRYENYGSDLDHIPGVGPKRKAELLGAFRTVRAIREASMEQLLEVVPKNTAKAVRDYYENYHGNSPGAEAEVPGGAGHPSDNG